MADLPIEEIRRAVSRIHKVAIGESTEAYMSIPADPQRDADLILSAAIDELAALRVTRDQRERELVWWQQRIDEVCSLKRRISKLRGVVKREGWLHVVADDDAARRRFEKKQRKAVRGG